MVAVDVQSGRIAHWISVLVTGLELPFITVISTHTQQL